MVFFTTIKDFSTSIDNIKHVLQYLLLLYSLGLGDYGGSFEGHHGADGRGHCQFPEVQHYSREVCHHGFWHCEVDQAVPEQKTEGYR